jgi:phage terminase small subunit
MESVGAGSQEHNPTESFAPPRLWGSATMQVLANDSQRRFVIEFLVDCNGTKAALRAGYSGVTAASQASRLLKDVKIQQALNAVRDRLATRLELSIEDVLQELIENVAQARVAGQYSSAVRGLELIGKHLGMFDRQRTEPEAVGATMTEMKPEKEDERTDAEQLGDFADDVRMLASQRQQMNASVEEFLEDLEELSGNAA